MTISAFKCRERGKITEDWGVREPLGNLDPICTDGKALNVLSIQGGG